MPKVESEKRSEKKSGWGTGQLFGAEKNENTFQGGGFKDKEKALDTIRLLTGRDPPYQFQIINSMYNRAKVIYKRTTDKEKRKNLNEAIETFEEWIDDYKKTGKSKENFAYLDVEVVESFKPLAQKYELNDFGFLEAFTKAEGDIKNLRAAKVKGKETTWDIERNSSLKEINKNIKENFIQLYETDEPLRGLPSKDHTKMIMLGYSADQSKLKKTLPLLKKLLES